MGFENIAPVGSPERTAGVSREWRSRHRREWSASTLPESEPPSKAGTEDGNDVEFSMLDPEIGAILANVNPAAYAQVANRLKDLLSK